VYCSVHKSISDAKIIQLLDDLAPELFVGPDVHNTGALAQNEYQLVNQAMIKFHGNKELAAQYLGISQTTLWRRLKRINENNRRGQQHA
jgi:propionate catabolism operon transcriptional regulator